MARRKRLSVTQPVGHGEDGAAPETKALFAPPAPPIARVAGQAAHEAALTELAQDIRRAREEGRLVQALPLDTVDAGYLMRDRIAMDEGEMEALVSSLRDRGQQTPIEVVELAGGRYGLISGWRRLQALGRLAGETGEPRFSIVQALLRRPETSADAYRAMVEENEIRVGLSYYERARIVVRAAGEGVYPDRQAALAGLFGSASRAKRSKIGSFMRICDAFDDRLRFAAAIPERLGLALAREIEADPGFAPRLRERLRKASPGDAGAELALLEKALMPTREKQVTPAPADTENPLIEPVLEREELHAPPSDPAETKLPAAGALPGMRFEQRPGRIVLEGPAVTEDFIRRLSLWLAGDIGG